MNRLAGWLAHRWTSWQVNRRIRHGDQHDVYVHYSPWPVDRTIEVVVAGTRVPVLVDLDAMGELVGVELLSASMVHIDGRTAR